MENSDKIDDYLSTYDSRHTNQPMSWSNGARVRPQHHLGAGQFIPRKNVFRD